MTEEERYAGHNWVWDKVGRAIFGAQENPQADPGLLGGIPVVGDIGRAPGVIWRGIADAGGVAVNEAVVKPMAELFGRLPSTTGLTDYNLGNGDMTSAVKFNDPKYSASADGAVALMNDLVKENGQDNIAKQFMILGQWQQANDPESFANWQKALKEAQDSTGIGTHAGEILSSYLKHYGAAYNDMTSTGVEGLLDVMPEMAYGSSGSFGQGLTNDLSWLGLLQRKAERGAANVSGRPGGLLSTERYSGGHPEMGSRLDDLLGRPDDKLTEVEQIAKQGLTDHGWTSMHALNFLITHGQGYSSDPGTQLAVGFALDPLFVAGTGAALPAKISARVAAYANTATSASRITRVYQEVAKAIGTTVEAVRTDPVLGPISKVARSIVDPFSAIPGPKGQAKVDVFSAAGLKGYARGVGEGDLANAARRARGWAAGETFNEAVGMSAMNTSRKWAVNSIVDNLLKVARDADVPIESRQIIAEDVIQQAGTSAAKDAVSRVADFTMANRKYWLSSAERASTAERIAKMVNQPLDVVLKGMADMTDGELAIWHHQSYSTAFRDFVTAVQNVPAGEWGAIEKRLDDLVILNPHELDHVAAQTALKDLVAVKGAKRVALWNQLADKYDLIENLGRVRSGGQRAVERKMNALQAVIERGGLHTALDAREMKGLPNSFKRDFMDHWIDSQGQQMWRLGFKPSSEMATGLLRDEAGNLIARFSPSIDNVTTAIRKPIRATPVADALGRVIPGAVQDSRFAKTLTAAKDTMETAINTSRDMVSGERIMTSMEQSFSAQLRSMGVGSKAARQVFKLSREFAQDRGFTIAAMSPDDFLKVAQPVLTDIDAKLIKRDVYTALVRSAGGDLRLLGLTPHLTQRIRSGLVAHGLDANNWLGKVTVEMYSKFRYALNPTFFIQAVADAPWFNMYRGIGPVLRGSRALETGAIAEMRVINDALGHTGLYRDLAADITDRAYTIGWQQSLRDGLTNLPGVKEGLGTRLRQGFGNMILANELKFMNSRMGDMVWDALNDTQKFVDDKIANAASAAEREAWQNARTDSRLMIENYKAELEARLGRVLDPNEVGRRYLAEVMNDSLLEKRTADNLLDYSEVYQKGQYHVPTSVGKLEPLHLDAGARSLGLPNIHNADDLRKALKSETVHLSDVADLMKENNIHPQQIKRFTDAISFNWRTYFNGLASDLGMTRFEMAGIEDLIGREARAMGMTPVDYLTQVKSVTAGGTKGLEGLTPSMQRVLKAMRLSDKGGVKLADAADIVLDNMHPSMKDRLLQSFEQSLTGPNGAIEKAQAAGDVELMQGLNRTVEELRGGWTPGAAERFKTALRERIASGVEHTNPEVERAFRYFSDYVQNLNPKLLAGEQLKEVVDAIPVAGGSAYDMTQHVLMNALGTNFRLAEKDAIRLAHMPVERSVLDRSLNHPFFGMYPSSYWWGKVIPETFKFIAYEPFGLRTTLGAEAYYKVQQTIALQSQYDDRMKALWDGLGKSAIVSLVSYLSPGMPWEDMKSNLPPWFRSMSKDGFDPSKMIGKEFDTMSPERWVSHFLDAAAETGDIIGGAFTQQEQPTTLPPLTQQSLQNLQPGGGAPAGAPTPAPSGPVQGANLGPTLQNSMDELQRALSGQ